MRRLQSRTVPRSEFDDLFRTLVRAFQPSIICDVGAFSGTDSIAMKACSPNAKSYAFEASPFNYKEFCKNPELEINGVEYINLAISESSGVVDFFALDMEKGYDECMRGASSLLERKGDHSYHKVRVGSATLDDFFRDKKTSEDTFALWIDVEGMAYNVIQGAASVLNQTVVAKIEVETYEAWNGQKLASDVRSALELHNMCELWNNDTGAGQFDILAVNRSIM